MQTGTALFFGLALVAIAIFYNSTKDRWNWKKIVKKTLLIPVGLIALGLIIWLYLFIEKAIDNRAIKQTALEGVKIGEKTSEVLFKKGKPLSSISDNELFFYSLPEEAGLAISFKEDKVDSVTQFCNGEGRIERACPFYPEINGIKFKTAAIDVENKLGKPDAIKCSSDHLSRVYSYQKYQTEYSIDNYGVFAIRVYDGKIYKDGPSLLKVCE